MLKIKQFVPEILSLVVCARCRFVRQMHLGISCFYLKLFNVLYPLLLLHVRLYKLGCNQSVPWNGFTQQTPVTQYGAVAICYKNKFNSDCSSICHCGLQWWFGTVFGSGDWPEVCTVPKEQSAVWFWHVVDRLKPLHTFAVVQQSTGLPWWEWGPFDTENAASGIVRGKASNAWDSTDSLMTVTVAIS